MSLLPERLRELRKSFNYTQQRVADDLQISRKLLSNYELGLREPNIDLLQTLAEYYLVSVDYLIGASSVENPRTYYPAFVINRMNDTRHLSSESISDLEKYVELLQLRDKAKQQQK